MIMAKCHPLLLLAATAFSFFIMGGYLKGFGIFFSAFLQEFEASASIISLVLGVRSIVFALVAPLATSLCDRLTERVVLIFGGLMHFISGVLSSQARSTEMLIFVNGGLGGVAVGCTFGPIQVTIGKYFKRRKSLAMSIVFCGATLGQIVMSPVIVQMLEVFGLRGTLLLYAALLLHLCVTGALARPVKMEALPLNHAVSNGLDTRTEKQSKALEYISKSVEMQDIVKKEIHSENTTTNSQEIPQLKPLINEDGIESHELQKPEVDNGTSRRDKTVRHYCRAIFATFLDISLCKSPGFVLYVVSCILTFVPFINVMIYLFPHARQRGLSPESAALLLTIIGACEIVGRFSMGVLADIKRLGPKKLYVILTLLTGALSIGFSFCRTFTSMAVICGFLGLFGSAPIVLTMSITVEIVSVSRIAKGLGFVAFFQGIFNTLSPPLLGLLKDVTGTYDAVFYISGGLTIIGSVVMAFYPLTRKCCRRDVEEPKAVEGEVKVTVQT